MQKQWKKWCALGMSFSLFGASLFAGFPQSVRAAEAKEESGGSEYGLSMEESGASAGAEDDILSDVLDEDTSEDFSAGTEETSESGNDFSEDETVQGEDGFENVLSAEPEADESENSQLEDAEAKGSEENPTEYAEKGGDESAQGEPLESDGALSEDSKGASFGQSQPDSKLNNAEGLDDASAGGSKDESDGTSSGASKDESDGASIGDISDKSGSSEDAAGDLSGEADSVIPDKEALDEGEENQTNESTEAAQKLSDEANSGTCGENLTWTLDKYGKLTISGTGEMYNYPDDEHLPWDKESVNSIVVNEGVTSVGNYAFSYMENLSSVSLPSSLKSLGDYTFACYSSGFYSINNNLKSLKLHEGLKSIGRGCFKNCGNLKTINIPSTVDEIGSSAFNGCGEIAPTLSIPDGVKSIEEYTFTNCSSLTSIVLPEGLESIGDSAFRGCSSLNTSIPSTVKYIGASAFQWSGISSAKIPEGIEKIETGVFDGCSSLSSVALPSSLTAISNSAFCESGISDIVFPSGLESIGDDAFSMCESLKSAPFPEGLESIGARAFSGCVSLKAVALPSSLVSIGDEAFEGSAISSISIPDSVGSIGESMFSGCSSLTSAEIGSGIPEISLRMFYETGIKNIQIPENIAIIGDEAFGNCKSLTEISVPDSVKSIGSSAFSGCESLKTVSLPESISTLNEGLFSGCKSLKSITIPDSVSAIGDRAFSGCSGLKSIDITDNVAQVGQNMFESCSSLTKVSLPDSLQAIPSYTFDGCGMLGEIDIPGSVTSIGRCAFRECKVLSSISLPSKVEWIDDEAFYGCSILQSIILPAGITSIGDEAFNSCISLKDAYFEGSEEDFKLINGYGNLSSLSNLKMHYNSKGPGEGASIEGAEIKLSQENFVYDGNAKTPTVSVSLNGTTLKHGTHYSVKYQDNTDIGTAKCIISGKSGYTGTVEKDFYITKAVQSLKASIGKSKLSIGASTQISVSGNLGRLSYVSSNEEVALVDASGKVSAKSIGKATITIKAEGSESYDEAYAEVDVEVAEEQKDIKDAIVSFNPTSYVYDGTEKTPLVSVSFDGSPLFAGTDYLLSYTDNKKAGTASLTIQGTGQYSGSLTKYFTIEKAKPNLSAFAIKQKLSVGGSTAISSQTDSDAELSYSSSAPAVASVNKSTGKVSAVGVGKAYIAVTAPETSNFKGDSTKVEISVTQDLEDATVSLTSSTYTYTGSAIKPSVKVRIDGELLQSGTDYSVGYRDNLKVGTATLTVTGKNFYTGSKDARFTITKIPQTIQKVSAQAVFSGQTSSSVPSLTGKNLRGQKVYKSLNASVATISSAGKIFGKKPGTAKIQVYCKESGNYAKSNVYTFSVAVKKPATPSISSISSKSKGFLVKWSKKACGGYIVEWALDSKFKKSKGSKQIKKASTTKLSVSNLKKGKTYYVRIYAYGSSTSFKSTASKVVKIKAK